MFSNPCSVTTFESAVFFVLAIAFGLAIGSGLAALIRARFSAQALKVGCLAMPVTALLAGYIAASIVPGRQATEGCGATPDFIFFPGYAFIIAPFAMLVGLFLFLRSRRPG